jgi:methionine synthase II (cobalamin-independent)
VRLAWVGRDRATGRPELAGEAAGTLEPFLRALGSRPAGWLKLQATGPVTLALELDAGGRPAFAVPSARGPLALGYAARIRSVVTRVREALPTWKVLLVLDEPSLARREVAERPGLAVDLWRSLGATGADVTGLHCCATPPWGLILDLDPQLVSFDAIRDGDAATDDPAFRRLVESGSAVAWGLVPATGPDGGGAPRPGAGEGQDPDALDPEALADRLLDLVEWTAGDYLPEVLARSLVTPTCGLASLSAEEATRRLALAAAVGPCAWEFADLP